MQHSRQCYQGFRDTSSDYSNIRIKALQAAEVEVMKLHNKHTSAHRARIKFPLSIFALVFLIGCNRSLSWSSGFGSGSGPIMLKQGPTAAAAAAAGAASSAAAFHSMAGSTAQQTDSEWNAHIIYNGSSKGRLDQCPDSSSSWSSGTWTAQVDEYNPGGYMLPHSARVQQMIWEHQNPTDCSTAKFLLYRHPRLGEGSHGVGSLLHLETTALLLALNSGRVLAEIPGTFMTDHPYCGNRSTLDSCYFEPLTHCVITPEQIASARVLNGTSRSSDQLMFQKGKGLEELPQFLLADKLFPQKSPISQTIPRPFQEMLKDAGLPSKNAYYWWRSQAIAYIVRPNKQALQELAVRKRDKLRGLPLAPGCVSVYIRHGDKHTEHKTFEDAEYEEALIHLRRVDPNLTRQVFLSTEDPATVVYFTNATRNWATSYVDMPRKPDRKKNNIVYMKEHGFAEEMLDGLLNLDLALQCDGFVSSINSNWARLIDELRSTVRCKAHAKYMDAQLRSPKGFFFWY